MTRTVTIYCTGTKKKPHDKKPATVAVFQPIETESGEQWEVIELPSRDYRSAWENASTDPTMAGFDALRDHPGRPRDDATQHMVDNVPIPHDMEGVEGIVFWEQHDSSPRYVLRCKLCGRDERVKSERLWPLLTTTNPSGYSESRLALSEVAAIV